jgi:hypothetical protein
LQYLIQYDTHYHYCFQHHYLPLPYYSTYWSFQIVSIIFMTIIIISIIIIIITAILYLIVICITKRSSSSPPTNCPLPLVSYPCPFLVSFPIGIRITRRTRNQDKALIIYF